MPGAKIKFHATFLNNFLHLVDPYSNYIFASEKIFVGQKSRLPAAGKIFRAPKKGAGNEMKSHFSDALSIPPRLLDLIQIISFLK